MQRRKAGLRLAFLLVWKKVGLDVNNGCNVKVVFSITRGTVFENRTTMRVHKRTLIKRSRMPCKGCVHFSNELTLPMKIRRF